MSTKHQAQERKLLIVEKVLTDGATYSSVGKEFGVIANTVKSILYKWCKKTDKHLLYSLPNKTLKEIKDNSERFFEVHKNREPLLNEIETEIDRLELLIESEEEKLREFRKSQKYLIDTAKNRLQTLGLRRADLF